jgi:glycosyltransferase involved in cell wall biosynthesis
MKLSVLMSVYRKESPDFLAQSLESLCAQTVQADEVVVVKDGPLGEELNATIDSFCGKLQIVAVPLEKNVGLGLALRAGLVACRGELVARMDTDDICCADRFEKQLVFFAGNPDVDVVGGAIGEFESDRSKIEAIRRLPSSAEELSRFARFRNPLNHMTVMFRKASVIEAGNYERCANLEDYHLWARMLMRGAQFHNLPDILVYARCGNGMQLRRGGLQYLTEEIKLHSYFAQIGFLSTGQFLRNIVTRAPVRMAPVSLRSMTYRGMLRQS